MSAIAVSNPAFVQIPLEILKAPLGDKAKLLWVELKRLSNKNTHTVYAYMEHMARYLGCTVRHVRNIIRQLIDAKVIEDTGKVNGFGNRIFRFVGAIATSLSRWSGEGDFAKAKSGEGDLDVIPVKTEISRSCNSLDFRFREDDKGFSIINSAFTPPLSQPAGEGNLMQQAWQKIYETCLFDNRSLEELKQSKLFQDLANAEFLNLVSSNPS